MKTLEFNLRLNTPCFAGPVPQGTRRMEEVVKGPRGQKRVESKEPAYYPNDSFGLRIPALRGVLEFWYRALLGAQNHEAVYREQGRVFGSADLGQGLRLRYRGRPKFDSGELEAPPKYRNAFLYLGYGPMQTFRVPKHPGQAEPNIRKVSSHSKFGFRDAIGVSGEKAEGVFRFVATGTEYQRCALRRALILLHLFGGIGSRSRRGWGSVSVEADCIPSGFSASGIDEQIEGLWGDLSWTDRPEARARFSAFGPGCRVLLTPPIEGGYGAVLDEFYRRFEATRLWNATPRSAIARSDHDLEAQDARGGQLSAVPERLAFGMPYSPGSKRNKWSLVYAQESRLGGRDDGTGRRSSPLILKVHRLSNGDHLGIALLLNGTFLGAPGEGIGAKGKPGSVPPPDDYAAIHEFLSPTERTPSRDNLRSWTELELPGLQETS